MRKVISITLTAEDRVRLDTIIHNRNSSQKHVWRARMIVLTADGEGTTAISRTVGKGKTVVWRWQARFMHEGIAGLTRDKTRPSRVPSLTFKISNDPKFADKVKDVVGLYVDPPAHAVVQHRREKPNPSARPHPAGTVDQARAARP
jgi:Homeodomain-like domain